MPSTSASIPIERSRWASPVKLKIDDGDYFRVKAFSTTDEPDVTATVIDSDLKDKYSADSEKARWVEYALAEPVVFG